MDNVNFLIIALSALIPLLIGFIWYNPKVFGTTWMNVCGLTEEKLQKGNMPLTFGLTYILSFFIAFSLMPIVIHSFSVASALGGFNMTPESAELYQQVLTHIGTSHLSFGHGVLHGTSIALLFVMPIMVINALFERKNFKYMAINVGFWIVSLALMGGVLCQFGLKSI